MNVQRLLLAVTLMLGVLLLSNLLYPPAPPPETPPPAGGAPPGPPTGLPAGEAAPAPAEAEPAAAPFVSTPDSAADEEALVEVSTPLFRLVFSSRGGVLRSATLTEYASLAREGRVELIRPSPGGPLGGTWLVGADSVNLADFRHRIEPAEGIRLDSGDAPAALVFRYEHPDGAFFSEIRYTFAPDSYVFEVEGRLPRWERTALRIDLGRRLEYNEASADDERRSGAMVGNHPDEGITSRPLEAVGALELIEGPLAWAALKSKFFVTVVLPGPGMQLGNAWAIRDAQGPRVHVAAPVGRGGDYAYRVYAGPVERERLVAVADQLEELNPYGWKVFRPIVRPFVNLVLWTINVLHEKLALSYGLVLMVIGVLMRIVLWPLNQKATRSSIRMQSVQPLVAELRAKHKDNPQMQQREMMKLYKEQGINPLAGCVPILLPWPMLIALFLVFRDTIQLRGESFLWLPDLSSADPYWIMPLLVGASMLLLQLITIKLTTGWAAANPQMKAMAVIMPVGMAGMFLYFDLASGLNLYYTTVNLATIPQTVLVALERRKAGAVNPAAGRPKRS